jgi:eukaryotic-like serine/threonine-protein kinase
MATTEPPAARLEGLTLDTGWRVTSRLPDLPGKTGGYFSCQYTVERDGHQAFLKALDYSKAEEIARQCGIDELHALQILVEAYNFERDLLYECAEKRMDRVVIAMEDGNVRVDPGPFGTVFYLIFERADGDVRSHLAATEMVELAWLLRCLHHVATGLFQLHSAKVAHQDLKPSNVLVFERTTSKVADLGSASVKGQDCPRDNFEFAGDGTYAPPELLYGQRDGEWNRRRQACDVYHLGSLVVFFFCGVGMTSLVLSHMQDDQRPQSWAGTYQQILPEVRDAFGKALQEFEANVAGDQLKVALREIVSQLCDPDPAQRGHPRNRTGIADQYSLERYVGRFNLLALRAKIGVLESV